MHSNNRVKQIGSMQASYREGIALSVFTCFCYAFTNCIIKEIGAAEVPTSLMLFYRELFVILLLLPFGVKLRVEFRDFFKKDIFFWHMLRGLLSFVGGYLWAKGVSLLPITECVAISFVTPLLISCMAVFVFKETISLLKGVVLLLGFSGALVVIAPNPQNFNLYMLLVLGAAFAWAAGVLVMKVIVRRYSAVTAVFFVHLVTICFTLPGAIDSGFVVKRNELGWIFVVAIVGTLSKVAITAAYKKAHVSFIAPSDFTRLIFTAITGYFFFGEVVAENTIWGAIIIMSCVSYIAFLDDRAAKKLDTKR